MNIRPQAFPLFVAALIAAAAVESHSPSAVYRRGALGNDPSKISGQYCTLSYLPFPSLNSADRTNLRFRHYRRWRSRSYPRKPTHGR